MFTHQLETCKHSRNRIGQRRIQNPVKHLKWSVLQKIVNGFQLLTIFAKHSILDVWQGFKTVSVISSAPLTNQNITILSNNRNLTSYGHYIGMHRRWILIFYQWSDSVTVILINKIWSSGIVVEIPMKELWSFWSSICDWNTSKIEYT